jgi:hypothetical protein
MGEVFLLVPLVKAALLTMAGANKFGYRIPKVMLMSLAKQNKARMYWKNDNAQ